MGNTLCFLRQSNKLLVGCELEHMAALFVLNAELRQIFAQYFLTGDWISEFLDVIGERSSSSRRKHVPFLLPSGGYLLSNENRTNFTKVSPQKPTLQKQPSLLRDNSTVHLSSSLSFNSLHHTQSLSLQSPPLVLATAVSIFAHSQRFADWQRHHEDSNKQQESNSIFSLKRIPSMKRVSSRVSRILPTSLRKNSFSSKPSSVAPIECQVKIEQAFQYHENDSAEIPGRNSKLSVSVDNEDNMAHLSSSSPKAFPSKSPCHSFTATASSTVLCLSSTQAEGSLLSSGSDAGSTLNDLAIGRSVSLDEPMPAAKQSSSPSSLKCKQESPRAAYLRALLLKGIQELSSSRFASQTSSTSSTHSLMTPHLSNTNKTPSSPCGGWTSNDKHNTTKNVSLSDNAHGILSISQMLASEQWLQLVVKYVTEECPVAMTLSETLTTNKYVFANSAFAKTVHMTTGSIVGQSMQLFVHESCAETSQLSLLEEAERQQKPIHLATTLFYPNTQQKQLHCISQIPIVSRQDSQELSLQVHYAMPSYDVHNRMEDLQVVDAFTLFMTVILA